MLRDVEMQDTPAIVADDKETVEDAERDRGHGEEVHRRNRFSVILKKLIRNNLTVCGLVIQLSRSSTSD
jgi:hypothetical protein